MIRKSIFWIHLAVGVALGLVIGLMSFTGLLLSFEAELTAWAERDARVVAVPADAKTLPLDALIAAAKPKTTGTALANVVVAAKPEAAVVVSFGRGELYYVNPYTAEVRTPNSSTMRQTLHTVEEVHRWLAQEGDRRPTGKAITGAGAMGFFFLGLSGLYLWWPRSFKWRGLRPITTFTRSKGRARDWNWHNVFGFWALPFLILTSGTGLIMSYKWANDLLYRVAGDTPPPPRSGPASGPAVDRPSPDALPANYDALLNAARALQPDWTEISLRWPGQTRGEAGRPSDQGGKAPEGRKPRSDMPTTDNGRGPRGLPAVTATVRTAAWPTFATTSVTLNPYTAQPLKTEAFAQGSTGRKARAWARYLHTGEAFGIVGKTVAALSAIAGLVLVYTGFALAIRRFFFKRASNLESP